MQWFVCLWFVCFAWITTSISVWLVYTYQLEWVNSCHDVLVSTPYCYCLYFISQHLNVTRVWMFHNKHACASRKALSIDAADDVYSGPVVLSVVFNGPFVAIAIWHYQLLLLWFFSKAADRHPMISMCWRVRMTEFHLVVAFLVKVTVLYALPSSND